MGRKTLDTCRTPGCKNESRYKKARLCNACYSYQYRWMNATPTEKMHRLDQIEQLSKRANAMLLSSNVKKFKQG